MAGERRDDARKGRLERVAREVVRAAAAGEDEAQRVADSPFLYTRVRARIEEERRRREEGESWLALFGVAWRAVPALSLVAVMALALFLSSGAGDLTPGPGFGLGAETLLGEDDIEQVVFADTRAPSNDEVLSTIIAEGENSR